MHGTGPRRGRQGRFGQAQPCNCQRQGDFDEAKFAKEDCRVTVPTRVATTDGLKAGAHLRQHELFQGTSRWMHEGEIDELATATDV
jgi:hypothetical protein